MADHDKKMEETVAVPSSIDPLKQLEGEWSGKAGHGGEETIDATVIYRATANGTAVMETLFPGTPHEMVSMYTASGKHIALDHYCSMGNQPRMMSRATTADGEIRFDFVPTPGID